MKYFAESNDALHANFVFLDFSQAWAFMNEVAILAEKQNHHPNWTNVWNAVTISLSTHDHGNVITDKDIQLANSIESLYDSRYAKD